MMMIVQSASIAICEGNLIFFSFQVQEAVENPNLTLVAGSNLLGEKVSILPRHLKSLNLKTREIHSNMFIP